jgi:hypothetical protein
MGSGYSNVVQAGRFDRVGRRPRVNWLGEGVWF